MSLRAKASSCKKLRGLHVLWEHKASREWILLAMLGVAGFGDVGYNKNLKLLSGDVIRHLKLKLFPQTALNADCPFVFGVLLLLGRERRIMLFKFSH